MSKRDKEIKPVLTDLVNSGSLERTLKKSIVIFCQ